MGNTKGSGGRRRQLRADAATAALIMMAGIFLAGAGAQLARRLQSSAARRQGLSYEEHIGLAANAAGLILVVWWALSFTIAVAAAMLDRRGSTTAAAATARFTPAFMRRLALTAVGLQLATAPLAHAGTRTAGPAAAPPPAIAALRIPGTGPAAAGAPGPQPAPSAPGTAGPGIGVDPHWIPARLPVDPGGLAPTPLRDPLPAHGTAEVAVREGDSLWSISAAALGPLASDVDIALAWPRLYAANRDIIGSDPSLLMPGQILRVPFRP
ncbi:LysM peptidoglycan-binding domain-containing protein [Arthrobacter sp. Hor0625]|uniref:LysM peptidoglycan-binding domain-containing protein n=1 Tax=Arthrobacter sp. Hor0625 TaxID=3457358 RepID=UPI00403E9155